VVVLIAAFIFVQSSRPSPSLGDRTVNDVMSYIAHLGLYTSLAFAAGRAAGVRSLRSVLLVAAAATIYGATDELHQMLVPSRESSLIDLGVDAVGALIGTTVSARHWTRR
jgi:VanZ family protein